MEDINAEYIERYQKLYEADPKSKIFAPLAEGYRKMGLIKEGIELAEEGVRNHPLFAGGRVALGRLYLSHNQVEKAEIEFRKATELAPENLLAHQMLAETLLRLKKTKESLKAYKLLLFLNPESEKAKTAVKKLESLTADEYDSDFFAMKPLSEAVKKWSELELEAPEINSRFNDDSQAPPKLSPIQKEQPNSYLERFLSLADAYMVRHDTDSAIEALNEAERMIGPHAEIVKRLKIIHQRQLTQFAYPKNSADLQKMNKKEPTETQHVLDSQIDYLQDLLRRIKKVSYARNK